MNQSVLQQAAQDAFEAGVKAHFDRFSSCSYYEISTCGAQYVILKCPHRFVEVGQPLRDHFSALPKVLKDLGLAANLVFIGGLIEEGDEDANLIIAPKDETLIEAWAAINGGRPEDYTPPVDEEAEEGKCKLKHTFMADI